MSLTYTVEHQLHTHVPGVQDEVITYTFSDGEVWQQLTEWIQKPKAGWRSGRCVYFLKAGDGWTKKQSRAFYKKLGEATAEQGDDQL
jgi:hypothetical protein